jgi:hypothetical protein
VVGNSVHMWKGEIREKLTKTNPGLSGESWHWNDCVLVRVMFATYLSDCSHTLLACEINAPFGFCFYHNDGQVFQFCIPFILIR